MSTRSNIVIKCGETTLHLYRHWDGYPAETGAHLLETFLDTSKSLGANAFVRALLADCEDNPDPNGNSRYHYEVTSGLHGDIEHAYSFTLQEWGSGSGSLIEFSYGRCPIGGELTWQEMPLGSFAELVNSDRRSMNLNLARLRASSPALYGDSEDYPMVSVPEEVTS